MGGVRFTKAERELIRKLLSEGRFWERGELATADSIRAKLEKSEMVKGTGIQPGIGWVAASRAMREILGDRLAVPPNPDVTWMMKMSNRIRDLGLSAQDCRSIAKVLLAKNWRVYSFEKAIWAADTLLVEAQLDLPHTQTPRRTAEPLAME